MAATHAISESERGFQNRIPRKMDKKFYILKISMIYWIGSNFLKLKNRPQKKVISISIPGIQPNHTIWAIWYGQYDMVHMKWSIYDTQFS